MRIIIIIELGMSTSQGTRLNLWGMIWPGGLSMRPTKRGRGGKEAFWNPKWRETDFRGRFRKKGWSRKTSGEKVDMRTSWQQGVRHVTTNPMSDPAFARSHDEPGA